MAILIIGVHETILYRCHDVRLRSNRGQSLAVDASDEAVSCFLAQSDSSSARLDARYHLHSLGIRPSVGAVHYHKVII